MKWAYYRVTGLTWKLINEIFVNVLSLFSIANLSGKKGIGSKGYVVVPICIVTTSKH